MRVVFDFRMSRRIEKEQYVKCTTLSGGIFYVNHI